LLRHVNLSSFRILVFVGAAISVPALFGQLSPTPSSIPPGTSWPPIQLKTDTKLNPLATASPTGFSPIAISHFYTLDQITNTGSGQIIGVVTAYDDPNIESDLGVFNTQYKLTACTTANGCFKKIYASGTKPATDSTWALEASLDVEWAHAIAPAAKIYLVEAASNNNTDLLAAVDVAVNNGATIVSMSFGGPEVVGENNTDFHFTTPKVTFVAAAGDSGHGVQYPSASPYVLAIGGTTVTLGSNNTYGSEKAWSGSGGGQSAYETMMSNQTALPVPNGNGKRAVPDVAYSADPNNGFSIYDSIPYNGFTGWFTAGGTSAGAPQWAAILAIVNSMRVAAKKQVLGSTTTNTANYYIYNLGQSTSYSTYYHDITTGTNGTCGTLCTGAAKYDYVTGLGSPQGKALINAIVAVP
jgi:subtilase family serine protease